MDHLSLLSLLALPYGLQAAFQQSGEDFPSYCLRAGRSDRYVYPALFS